MTATAILRAQIFRVRREAGVYKITCLKNGKIYIGSSVDLRRRLLAHCSKLASGKHVNPNMQASWNAHGADYFKFEVLLVCSQDNVLFYEQALIDGFDSVKQGFNVALFAGAPARGMPVSAATRKAISDANRGRKMTAEAVSHMTASAQANKELTAANSKKMWAHRSQEYSAEIFAKIASKNTGQKRTVEVLEKFRKSASELWSTEAHREKMVAAHVGRAEPVYSTESKAAQRAKISAWRSSPEGVAATRAVHLGKKVSEETRAKMIASAIAREARKKAGAVA